MWRSEQLGNAFALSDESLHQSLNHIGQDLIENFRVIVYDMGNPAPWEPERVHDGDFLYVWEMKPAADRNVVSLGDGADVTNTSMAELAERKLRDTGLDGCLINIDGSALDDVNPVDLLKVDHARVALPSFCTDAEFVAWFRRYVAHIPAYSDDENEPPRDEQTCLADRTLYEPTGREFQGRKIYRHTTSRQLYYVDNLHFGAAAHIEIFDKFGRKHVGEASLDGKPRPNTKDPNKKPIDV